MQHTASLPFSGNLDYAFDRIEVTLTALGFQLTERTADSLEMVGPGMRSTQQSPLVGASRVHFRAISGKLSVDADLGAAEFLARFATLFPLGLCLFLAVIFRVLFGIILGGNWIIPVAVTGLLALVWLVLGPLIARSIRSRTRRSLDNLLAAAAEGRRSGRTHSGSHPREPS